MQVILLERVEKLGQMGDIVAVRPGYARNFLLPQQKAMRATKDNLSQFEARRVHLEAENLKRRDEAEKVGAKAAGLTVTLIRAASETGQLYGSVTTRDLAEAVTEAGVSIERRQVHLDRPIKTTGMIQVTIYLHPEVTMTVTANVARSADEANMQARGLDPNREHDDDEDEDEDDSLSLWDVEGESGATEESAEDSGPASFGSDDESR